MAGALDFLFQGSPPPNVNSSVESQINMPDWWQEYTRGLLARTNAIAAEPYMVNPVPGVADMTADQSNAYGAIRNNFGAYQPAMQGALGTMTGIANQSVDPVMDAIARLGTRNLTENLLPAIDRTFIGSGQFGSDRNIDFYGRAVRDSNESILNQQASSLLANQGQRLQAAQGVGALSSQGQTMDLRDAAALEAAGQQQQAQNQRNLDFARGQFTEERDYPKMQAQFMNQMIRGLNPPTSTTQMTSAPFNGTMAPSGLQTLLGTGMAAKALGLRRGGAVRRYARGGRINYRPMPMQRGALSMVC